MRALLWMVLLLSFVVTCAGLFTHGSTVLWPVGAMGVTAALWLLLDRVAADILGDDDREA